MKPDRRSLMAHWTIRRKLRCLTLLILGGFLYLSTLAHDTLNNTKVNGPYYDQIILGKDLIADVLPPPAYFIESYLLVLQMVETEDLAQLSSLMRTFDRLESEYVERQMFWTDVLQQHEMRELMVVQSAEPARQFFSTVRRDFFPLLVSGDRAEAEFLAKGVLRECYDRHRARIDDIVKMAKARIADDEQAARRVITERTTTLGSIALIVAALVAIGSELLGQRIATRLDDTVRVLNAVAAGDLSQHMQTEGHDELDQMGLALNQAIAASRDNLTAAREAEQTVREWNSDLEQRVSQRTRALHDSEQRLRSILDAAVDAIITIDGQGTIESVNPATEQIFRYSRAEMIGQNVKMLMPPTHREVHDGHLLRYKLTGAENVFGLRREVVGQRKDGTTFPADLAISKSKSPECNQFTGIVRDITRRKQHEAELAQAKEAAEVANREKSAFLATMSHELRTPLNGIFGMNELLLGTELNVKQRQFAEASHTSSKLLLQLVNNILDLSKIEAGKLELDLRECSVEALVYDVVEALGPVAGQKGLSLDAHVDPAACLEARCDDNRLRQVLVNLIGNAIKFTSSGEVSVRVVCTHHDAKSARVRFSVTDSGIGIPRDRRDRLFCPFTQVDSSTTRRFGGSGLGLAICQQLVELMGGQIGVDSEFGLGSTFRFEVPLQAQSHRPELSDAGHKLSEARVLFVAAANKDQAQILDCLKAWGCQVQLALNDVTAIQGLRAESACDAVLVQLPAEAATRCDLIDALSRHCGLPLIGFGTALEADEFNLLRQRGLWRLLHNPVRPSSLYDALVATLSVRTQASKAEDSNRSHAQNPVTLAAHILVVEDNHINQMYVVELLKLTGCTSDVASTGEEALHKLERERYALVLMDCQMPVMDGFTTVAEIRRREATHEFPGRTTVIALTANALKGDRERCLAAGMDDYLTKPIEAAQLTDVLRRFLTPNSESPNADEQAEQPINLKALQDQCLGNMQFASVLLQEFETTADERMSEIIAATTAGDLPQAQMLLHTLKGAAGILGATPLMQVSAQIEATVRDGQLNEVQQLVEQLQEEMNRCLRAIPEIRAKSATF